MTVLEVRIPATRHSRFGSERLGRRRRRGFDARSPATGRRSDVRRRTALGSRGARGATVHGRPGLAWAQVLHAGASFFALALHRPSAAERSLRPWLLRGGRVGKNSVAGAVSRACGPRESERLEPGVHVQRHLAPFVEVHALHGDPVSRRRLPTYGHDAGDDPGHGLLPARAERGYVLLCLYGDTLGGQRVRASTNGGRGLRRRVRRPSVLTHL